MTSTTHNPWRERILAAILLAGLLLGGLAYIPSVIFAVRGELWSVVVVDTLVYAWGIFIYLHKALSFRFRASNVLLVTYSLGVFLTIETSPMGGGMLWLFAFPPMTAVLLGTRPALVALVVNACTLGAVGLAAGHGVLSWQDFAFRGDWFIVTAANFLLLDAMVAVSIGVLLQGLERTIANERSMRDALDKERARMVEASSEIARQQTERRRAENANSRLAMAVEQSTELIVITDVDQRIEYANPSFVERSGFSLAELQRGELDSLVGFRPHEGPIEQVWQSLGRGDTWRGKLSGRTKQGRDYEAEATFSTLHNERGDVTHHVAVLRDMSREHALEQQLQQAQKLEAIGTLAGGIAHDFNNLLTPIVAYSESVRRDLPDGGRPRAELGEVIRAAQQAKALVRQILSFGRKMEVQRHPVRVYPVVSEALTLLRASLPPTIKVISQVDGRDTTILADPIELHQVVMNLGTNALQAMQATGGVLTISVRSAEQQQLRDPAHPNFDPSRRYVRLTVSDTGPGIAPEAIDRIFEPFFTTKKQGEGTGLGLATVHGIVTDLNGFVSVESTPAAGTEFSVFLPCHRRSGPTEPLLIEPELEPPATQRRVLLVDDEPQVLRAARRVLATMGYEVVAAASAGEALALLEADRQRIDVLVTDMTMPQMTGAELAKRAGELYPDLPVVVATGYAREDVLSQLDRLSVTLLTKPFDFAQLRQTLADLTPPPNLGRGNGRSAIADASQLDP